MTNINATIHNSTGSVGASVDTAGNSVGASVDTAGNSVDSTVDATEDNINTSTLTTFIIAKNLELFTNVDATELNDGSVLVYDMNTGQWTSTLLLDMQNMDGGEY